MMENTVKPDRYAIAVAAESLRKPDGSLHGRRLKELANMTNMSESTIRRIMEKYNVPRERKHPLTHLISDVDDLPSYERSPERALLVSLAMNAGILKLAHKFAVDACGFPYSYRTFIRRVDDLDPAVRAGAIGGHKAAIEASLYASHPSPHRNHRWHIDSTVADIRVLPMRGSTPFRPWLTVVVDRATNMYMSILVLESNPNAVSTQLALAMAAFGNECEGDDFIGGLPTTLVFDNGKENVNNAVTEACARLGIVASSTAPRHPWQNGSVERAHRNINQNLLSILPGSMLGGETPAAQRRFAPDDGLEADSETFDVDGITLTAFDCFAREIEKFRIQHNNTPGSDGMSPIQRWHADRTPIVRMDKHMILANMARPKTKRTVNKAGIRFRDVDYTSNAVKARSRQKLDIRYFPNVTDWIEVFDGDTYLGRAYSPVALPEYERDDLMIGRARDMKKLRSADAEARRLKNHMAHAINEGHDPESLPMIDSAFPTKTNADEPTSELPRLNKPSKRHKDEPKKQSKFVDSLANEFESEESA